MDIIWACPFGALPMTLNLNFFLIWFVEHHREQSDDPTGGARGEGPEHQIPGAKDHSEV